MATFANTQVMLDLRNITSHKRVTAHMQVHGDTLAAQRHWPKPDFKIQGLLDVSRNFFHIINRKF